MPKITFGRRKPRQADSGVASPAQALQLAAEALARPALAPSRRWLSAWPRLTYFPVPTTAGTPWATLVRQTVVSAPRPPSLSVRTAPRTFGRAIKGRDDL